MTSLIKTKKSAKPELDEAFRDGAERITAIVNKLKDLRELAAVLTKRMTATADVAATLANAQSVFGDALSRTGSKDAEHAPEQPFGSAFIKLSQLFVQVSDMAAARNERVRFHFSSVVVKALDEDLSTIKKWVAKNESSKEKYQAALARVEQQRAKPTIDMPKLYVAEKDAAYARRAFLDAQENTLTELNDIYHDKYYNLIELLVKFAHSERQYYGQAFALAAQLVDFLAELHAWCDDERRAADAFVAARTDEQARTTRAVEVEKYLPLVQLLAATDMPLFVTVMELTPRPEFLAHLAGALKGYALPCDQLERFGCDTAAVPTPATLTADVVYLHQIAKLNYSMVCETMMQRNREIERDTIIQLSAALGALEQQGGP